MQHQDFNYIDTALRGKESRNDVMTVQDYVRILLSPDRRIGISDRHVNCFRTWCRFDRSYETYWLSNKNERGSSSVRQYSGAHIFDFLFWDIDKAVRDDQGREVADLQTATELLQRLLEHVERHHGLAFDDFRIWLSAGKGYHVYLPAGLFRPWPHDLNAAASGIFTISMFPEGWVKQHRLGGVLDPATIKDINRLNREGGSRNFKEGREWNGYKVGCSKEMWEALQKDWRLYYEFAEKPTLLYLSEDYLDGSAYWQVGPNPDLVRKWQESLERAIVEKEGRRISVPVGAGSSGGYIPESLEMPQCIRNMHRQLRSGRVEPGFRHGVFMVIASFYSRLLPEPAVLALLSALNAGLENPKPQEEVDRIVHDVFERGYRTGCGNPNSDLGSTCLAFCNARASVDECPSHRREDDGFIAQRSTGIYTAYRRMVERMKSGPSPIKLGIEEWDTSVGSGHKPGQMLTFVGFPESAKTATVTRIVQDLCEVARSLNMLVMLFTPEHDVETVAELLVQQRGKMSGREIYTHVSNGGLDSRIVEWCRTMEDTLIPVNSVFFTVQDVERTLRYWEKKHGKRTMAVILDGVIFFSPGELAKSRRPDEEVAKYLKGLCVNWPFFGIYNLHVEKQGGQEADQDRKPSEQRLKGNAGFGTIHYFNASEFFVSLHRRDGGDVVWGIKKFRSGWNHVDPPKEIVFRFFRPHYYPYTQPEVDRLIKQYGLEFFGNDPRFAIPSNAMF